ncbi:MAG: N-acetylglucosamine-6-phosphate deacetylase [Elainellaceae cyanobacterium]
MYALTDCILHTGLQELIHHAILIDGMHIVDVVPLAQLSVHSTLETISMQGHHVAPGFIDLQLNGCGGVMFNDSTESTTLDTMHRTNLASGTTSFLPTLITTSDDNMISAMETVSVYRKHHEFRVLGLHLEGPYLNPKRKGIHDATFIRAPDRAMLDHIVNYGKETVRLLTLAPEMVAPDDIQLLVDQGILVSAGHSDATFEQGLAGFNTGIRMATHLFNAMSPWLSRSPGMVGAVLSRDDVYAGIIADGEHVHFGSIQLVKTLKRDKLILVTDATPPVGTHLDSFWIGGQEVFYRDGRCVSKNGTLGGSALTLIEAIANCVRHVNIPLSEALRMASTYPARLLGLDHQLGAIAPGYIANLAVFNDHLQITGVIDQGRLLFRRKG